MNEFTEFLQNVVAAIGPQIMTLFALIGANILAGIGLAIKQKKFEWSKLSDFFVSDVVPKLFGYLAVKIVVGLGALQYLGPDVADAVSQGIVTTAWIAVVASVGGDLLNKLASLGIPLLSAGIGRVPGVNGVSDKTIKTRSPMG